MANSRSWTQIWPLFVRVCFLNLVLNFKITALADDSGNGGVTTENTCKNTNYQTFLPPPYQNISHMICTPVWHTFELRVSSICCCLVVSSSTHSSILFSHDLLKPIIHFDLVQIGLICYASTELLYIMSSSVSQTTKPNINSTLKFCFVLDTGIHSF